MKRSIAMLSLFFLIAVGLHAGAGPREEAAAKAAQQWLALVDSGQYGESWQGTSSLFQGAVKKQQWEQMLTATRKPLGSMEDRKLKSADHKTSLPGAPDGEYVVLTFDTAFQNKKKAVETVTMQLEKDGTWKSSGYFIR